jgi:hypothetical protein
VVKPVVHAAKAVAHAVTHVVKKAVAKVVAVAKPVVRAVTHVASVVTHHVVDAYHAAVHYAVHTVKAVARTAARYVKAAVHVVKTAYHKVVAAAKKVVRAVAHTVARVAKTVAHAATRVARAVAHGVAVTAEATASFVKKHAATIASVAAGVVVFAGCEALTAGVGSIGCAAAAGAVSSLVSQGFACGSGQKGACSVSSFAKAAVIGGVTGAIGGAFGGGAAADLAEGAIGEAAAGSAADAASGSVAEAAAADTSGSVVSDTAEAAGERPALAEAKDAGEPAAPSCGQSFSAATPVLLASGATVAISKLRVGQKVLALDTRTGKNEPQPVAAVLVNHDTDLYELRVKAGRGTEVIDTTSNHPFWDPYLDKFIPANHLKTGERLKTPDGRSAVVVGGTVPANHDGWMWDLTVPGNGDHDFYVEPAVVLPPTRAGPTAAPVLVHNDSCPVFRGTTKGFEGSPGTQRVGVTPTSSDPGVATIFATHSQQFGDAVVQIATPEDIAGAETFPGYIASEAEVGVDMSPAEFASRASTEIPVGVARGILSRMGIDIPSRIGIGDLSPVLENTPKLTPSQVAQFIEEARGYAGG